MQNTAYIQKHAGIAAAFFIEVSQPTAAESCSPQPGGDVRAVSYQPPQ
jgi:hypothetical protein